MVKEEYQRMTYRVLDGKIRRREKFNNLNTLILFQKK